MMFAYYYWLVEINSGQVVLATLSLIVLAVCAVIATTRKQKQPGLSCEAEATLKRIELKSRRLADIVKG